MMQIENLFSLISKFSFCVKINRLLRPTNMISKYESEHQLHSNQLNFTEFSSPPRSPSMDDGLCVSEHPGGNEKRKQVLAARLKRYLFQVATLWVKLTNE